MNCRGKSGESVFFYQHGDVSPMHPCSRPFCLDVFFMFPEAKGRKGFVVCCDRGGASTLGDLCIYFCINHTRHSSPVISSDTRTKRETETFRLSDTRTK